MECSSDWRTSALRLFGPLPAPLALQAPHSLLSPLRTGKTTGQVSGWGIQCRRRMSATEAERRLAHSILALLHSCTLAIYLSTVDTYLGPHSSLVLPTIANNRVTGTRGGSSLVGPIPPELQNFCRIKLRYQMVSLLHLFKPFRQIIPDVPSPASRVPFKYVILESSRLELIPLAVSLCSDVVAGKAIESSSSVSCWFRYVPANGLLRGRRVVEESETGIPASDPSTRRGGRAALWIHRFHRIDRTGRTGRTGRIDRIGPCLCGLFVSHARARPRVGSGLSPRWPV